MIRSTLLRTATIALVLALVGNLWLVWLTPPDDDFANVVGIASIVVAATIVLAYLFARRFVGDLYLASLAVWVANLIEVATDDLVRTESQIRQGSFYAALAVLSLGCFLSTRERSRKVVR